MSKYWDIQKTLSYNALFNYIVGIRGAGKTYGALKNVISKHIKYGHNFMYVRRTEEELKKLATMKNGRLFNHVQVEFEGHNLYAESNLLRIDKEVMGYAQALSTARQLKSDAVDNVRTIIFDEFILDKGFQHYLPSEVEAFLELYESVARPGTRDYDVVVLFLANAVSVANPYFDYFGLEYPYEGRYWRKGGHLVEMVAPPELIAAKKATKFYQMIGGTDYAKYAAENEFLRDSKEFLGKKGKDAEYQFTITYFDECIGIWRDYKRGFYYVSADVDRQCRLVFAATTEDHRPNTLLLKGFKGAPQLKKLKAAYDAGCVRYESAKLKSWFRDIVRMAL